VSGVISATNSLVGSAANDYTGRLVTALSNGNYVVASPYWGSTVGAVTWGNGATGVSGVISAANSLVGSTAGDYIGCADSACSYASLTALSNGNYVVASSNWQNGVVGKFVGAVTWGNGATGSKGPVSAANSLVGSTTGDYVGGGGVTALSNGNYVVRSPWWQKGTTAGAGAITPGAGAACATGLTAGPITAANSVLGAAANGGVALNFGYDLIHHQLVVGRPADNIVSLFAFSCSNSTHRIFLPNIHK
jgi:hypothetical protein